MLIFSFQELITQKVEGVLLNTPLEIKPRRELPGFGKFKKNGKSLIDLENTAPPVPPHADLPPLPSVSNEPLIDQEDSEISKLSSEKILADCLQVPIKPETSITTPAILTEDAKTQENHEKLNILGFEVVDKPSPPKSPQNTDQNWELKQTGSLELLTPSPLGFAPFDSRSLDELMTPDDFAADRLPPGLSNINYDIDLSDLSGDNSFAEDVPKPRDPFSPDTLRKFDPLAPQPSTFEETLEKFNEFSLVDSKSGNTLDPFEVVHRSVDPFSPVLAVSLPSRSSDPFSPQQKESTSILDDNGSPTAACLLPSPLQPQSSKPS